MSGDISNFKNALEYITVKSNQLLWACVILFSAISVNIFADEIQDENLSARLGKIYQAYGAEPETSCRELAEILQTNDINSLKATDIKAAYYFLANCQYQSGQFDSALKNYLKV